jgi:CRISPR-associated protein Cmr1
MSDLKLTIETITPIWTGGAEGKMDRLHETGIMGSLRWWYEVIVRGVGGHACDPTSEKKCVFDKEQFDKSTNKGLPLTACLKDAGLCDACQVFGATGWKRRFRLEITNANLKDVNFPKLQTSGDRYKKDKTKGRPSWYFKSSAKEGIFTINIIPMIGFDSALIHGVLRLIQNHGGIASKTQLGCGRIKITDEPELDVDIFLKAISNSSTIGSSKNLPSLQNMFFLSLLVSAKGIQPVLDLKYDIRKKIREEIQDRTLRHYVMGMVSPKRNESSKIFFSQAIDGRMNIWGWIPENVPSDKGKIPREKVLDPVKNQIKSFGTFETSDWLEFPAGDKTRTAAINYLRMLIQRQP